jgi:hypothetical protein
MCSVAGVGRRGDRDLDHDYRRGVAGAELAVILSPAVVDAPSGSTGSLFATEMDKVIGAAEITANARANLSKLRVERLAAGAVSALAGA